MRSSGPQGLTGAASLLHLMMQRDSAVQECKTKQSSAWYTLNQEFLLPWTKEGRRIAMQLGETVGSVACVLFRCVGAGGLG